MKIMNELGIERSIELPDFIILRQEIREITIVTVRLYPVYIEDLSTFIAIDLGVITQKPHKLFEVF